MDKAPILFNVLRVEVMDRPAIDFDCNPHIRSQRIFFGRDTLEQKPYMQVMVRVSFVAEVWGDEIFACCSTVQSVAQTSSGISLSARPRSLSASLLHLFTEVDGEELSCHHDSTGLFHLSQAALRAISLRLCGLSFTAWPSARSAAARFHSDLCAITSVLSGRTVPAKCPFPT